MLAMQKKLEDMKLKLAAESTEPDKVEASDAGAAITIEETTVVVEEGGGEEAAEAEGGESKEAFMQRMAASRPQELVLGDADNEKKEEEEVVETTKPADGKSLPADQYLVITDKDTGETYHIDPATGETVELDEQFAPETYNLLASKEFLHAQAVALAAEEADASSRPSMSKAFGKAFKRRSTTETMDPNLVNVQSNRKDKGKVEYSKLRLAQTIRHHKGPIWTAKFSFDGAYLCTAGQEMVLHVWEVNTMEVGAGAAAGAEAPVFGSAPMRSYKGHKADVIDLAWSRSNFILSASMDNTVKLWHVTRDEELASFQHSDYVTSVQVCCWWWWWWWW
jgi:WD40 repeat protein